MAVLAVGLVVGSAVVLPGCSTLPRPSSVFHSSLNLMQAQSVRAANVLRSRESRMQASRELTRSATELARKKQTDEAIKAYAAAIELWPAETDNYGHLATLYQQQGALDAALKQLSQGLSYDANAIGLHLKMAEVYLQQRQPQLALSHTDTVMALQQSNADCWRYRASAYMQLSQIPEAMAACYQALAIRPDDESVLEQVCQIYFLQGRPMRAWSIVQKMSAKYTDENRPAKLRLLEAETLVQMDRNSDAIQTLKRWYAEGGDKDENCCNLLTRCLDNEAKATPQKPSTFAPNGKPYPDEPFSPDLQAEAGSQWRGGNNLQVLPATSYAEAQSGEPIPGYAAEDELFIRGYSEQASAPTPLQHNPLLWEQRPKFRPLETAPTDWR